MAKDESASASRLLAEDYELQPTSNSSEPLLPRYEAQARGHPAARDNFHSESPYNILQARRKRSQLRQAFSCICVTLAVLIPLAALAGCWFGRQTLDSVRSLDQWDQVPEEWREWLNKALPPEGNHGAFPTDIGYAGPTPTGSEAGLVVTAPSLPMHTGVSPLVPPKSSHSSEFKIMQHWGHLSPYYSVDSHGLPEATSIVPEQCHLEELHWLQRHGARYPTSYPNGPSAFASRLAAAKGWSAKGHLKFLNDWEYKLGAEVLTPFGRSQLFNLGVAARVKYGFLLDRMNGKLPVFRTESQDRMLRSAQNFATGFFGYPAEEQYNLEVMIEAPGFNCTLAPWNVCPKDDYNHGNWSAILAEWDERFLSDAKTRLQKDIHGYDLTTRDLEDMMEMCAYETVALGYSTFCNLFTKKEWKGFQYRWDLFWYYYGSFGSSTAKAQGIGYVEELLSRLTHTRMTDFTSTVNSTFHNDLQFPLRNPLYVDFTHDSMFALLLPTLNLTTFSDSGDLPSDHIPKHQSFVTSKLVPFATNLQFQVLSCGSRSEASTDADDTSNEQLKGRDVGQSKYIRLILNDAVVPLTGIKGCPEHEEGLCPLESFVESMKEIVAGVDFVKGCGVRGQEGILEIGDAEEEDPSAEMDKEEEIVDVGGEKGDDAGYEGARR